MNTKKVMVASEKAVRYFDSMQQAAEYIGTTVQNVSQAIKRDGIIKGEYKVTLKENQNEWIFGQKYQTGEVRVKEIFTRKPYSSTKLWRNDGREE